MYKIMKRISKDLWLVLLRYNNIGATTRGAIFVGDQFLCHTLEGPEVCRSIQPYAQDAACPKARYRLSKRKYKKVSLGGGYHRNGETRIYAERQMGEPKIRLTDEYKPIGGNICVGYFRTPFKCDSHEMLESPALAIQILRSLIAAHDFVFLRVIDATTDEYCKLHDNYKHINYHGSEEFRSLINLRDGCPILRHTLYDIFKNRQLFVYGNSNSKR